MYCGRNQLVRVLDPGDRVFTSNSTKYVVSGVQRVARYTCLGGILPKHDKDVALIYSHDWCYVSTLGDRRSTRAGRLFSPRGGGGRAAVALVTGNCQQQADKVDMKKNKTT